MLNLKSKYITAQDFLEYTGIDLNIELKDDDNPSNKVNAFLYRIENRMSNFIASFFYKDIDSLFLKFTDFQKLHYKFALIEQALYVLKNGDISVDSGYDFESNKVVVKKEDIENRIIGLNAKAELMRIGIWNRKITNVGRWGLGNWFAH